MMQFYFLAVALNLLGGYSLFIKDDAIKASTFEGVRTFLRSRTFRLVLGVLCGVTGFFKMIAVTDGDIPVVGDLVPALAALIVGFSLLFEYYFERPGANSSEGKWLKFNRFIAKRKKVLGVIGMAAALVHFLFPRVILL
jgi:hypothetical protein